MMGNDDFMKNKFSLRGKIALVTGATGYLGREMVVALSKAGAHVIINSRSEDKLIALAKELKLSNSEVTICPVDLHNKGKVNQLVKEILERFGKLNILINNAYNGNAKNLEKATLEDFSHSYDITVTSTYNLIMICKPFLEKAALDTESSSIINIASMYAHVSPDPAIYGESGFNNPPYYGAAKSGLIQLTKYLACHFAESHIRVNSISPGPFPPTNLESIHPSFYKLLCEKVPMKRVGLANEIQGPILFLASNAASFVTGIDLKIDGGWTAW